MAKQQDNLSHHEQLRLDYLYKNFHYLKGQVSYYTGYDPTADSLHLGHLK